MADAARHAPKQFALPVNTLVRRSLRALLLLLVAAWVVDLPGIMGIALYSEQFLALAVGLASALVLLGAQPARTRNLLPGLAVLGVFGVAAYRYPDMQASMVPATPFAMALAACMVVGVLEATRRRLGWFLPILVMALAGLLLAGQWLPAAFEPRPVAAGRVLVYLAFDGNALLGRILATATVVIVPFIVFGALFGALGGSGRFAMLIAKLIGRQPGATAKASVAGSAMFGMVSGSAVANVAAVGAISIPMMVRSGYPRHLAAGIEAVASTGGQLAPPIMGAAAFLMAEFLALPYTAVVAAAVLPAAMFYAALWMAVDFEARASARVTPRTTTVAVEGATPGAARSLLPVAVLVYLLFVAGWSPDRAAGVAVSTLVAIHLWGPIRRLPARAASALSALLDAMDPAVDIVLIGAVAGLVIGLLDVGGLSFALTLQALELGSGSLPALLAATAAVSVLLGMGMPTVGVYALLATLLAPALVTHGVPPLAAHLYVLYFGMFSMITPPVAIASVAAASLAGADSWRSSLASLRLAAGALLVPVAFVLQAELVLVGTTADTLVAALRLLLAIALMTVASAGRSMPRRSPAWRVLAVLLAIANIVPRHEALSELLIAVLFLGGLAMLTAARPLRAAVPT